MAKGVSRKYPCRGKISETSVIRRSLPTSPANFKVFKDFGQIPWYISEVLGIFGI